MDRDALRPEQRVRVRKTQPESVLLEADQHGVVDDPARLIRDHDVLALPHLAFREVPWRDRLCELQAVFAADLDLSLDADVPQRHMVDEMQILLERIRVKAGEVHVIVDVVRLRAGTQGRLEKRGLPIPRPEVEGALSIIGRHVDTPDSARATPGFYKTDSQRKWNLSSSSRRDAQQTHLVPEGLAETYLERPRIGFAP